MKQVHSTGRRLRSLRAAAHLTQAELAARAGLTLRDIQRMEQRLLNLPYRKFVAVTFALGTTVDSLLWELTAQTLAMMLDVSIQTVSVQWGKKAPSMKYVKQLAHMEEVSVPDFLLMYGDGHYGNMNKLEGNN